VKRSPNTIRRPCTKSRRKGKSHFKKNTVCAGRDQAIEGFLRTGGKPANLRRESNPSIKSKTPAYAVEVSAQESARGSQILREEKGKVLDRLKWKTAMTAGELDKNLEGIPTPRGGERIGRKVSETTTKSADIDGSGDL